METGLIRRVTRWLVEILVAASIVLLYLVVLTRGQVIRALLR
jgi:hypothetical protein